MSKTYWSTGGESWEIVARINTGDDLDAARIQQANPGVFAPIAPGTMIQIPDEVESKPADLSDTRITVNGQVIGTWSDLEVGQSIDAITKASFVVPNEPETRALFKPLSSPRIDIQSNREMLLPGRGETPEAFTSGENRNLRVSAYAHPGILEICHPPITSMPLEWTNANLTQIANELCTFHGIGCSIKANAGPLFKRVDIRENQAVLDFLSDLASQRGPVISSDASGRLLIWTGVTPGSPVAILEKGKAPVIDASVQFDESKYYSSVTGTIPAKTKKRGKKSLGKGKSFTVQNPFATDQVRPFTAEFQDIDEGELETAVNTLAGRMFSSVVSVSVELATWFDDSGKIYKPNTTVIFKSPEDFIENPYEFLIADATLRENAESKSASLRLVLPGVYSGEIPKVVPWQ